MMESLGILIRSDELARAIAEGDTDKSGELDYDEARST